MCDYVIVLFVSPVVYVSRRVCDGCLCLCVSWCVGVLCVWYVCGWYCVCAVGHIRSVCWWLCVAVCMSYGVVV